MLQVRHRYAAAFQCRSEKLDFAINTPTGVHHAAAMRDQLFLNLRPTPTFRVQFHRSDRRARRSRGASGAPRTDGDKQFCCLLVKLLAVNETLQVHFPFQYILISDPDRRRKPRA